MREVVSGAGAHGVQLRAGREGGDAFVTITEANPQYADLRDLLEHARFAAVGHDFAEPTLVDTLDGEASDASDGEPPDSEAARLRRKIRELQRRLATRTELVEP